MPTEQQQTLKELIDALPVFDSTLPVKDVEGGKFRQVERAVTDYAATLKNEGRLANTLNSEIVIDGQTTTLERYIREARRYQLTEDGNLYNTGSARRDEVAGIPGGVEGQGYRAQFAAFLAIETPTQAQALTTFINKLQKQKDAAALFQGGVRVFDIGYNNGKKSAKIATALQQGGVKGQDIIFNGMELVGQNSAEATEELVRAGLNRDHIHLTGGKLGFTDATMGDGTTPNMALTLESLPTEQRHDIVLALNVYNFGDRDLFWRQVDGAMKPGALTISVHDAGGDALDFRREVNRKAGKTLMRNAGEPATETIEAHFDHQGRKLATFDVPYATAFPPISDEMWETMSQVKTAMFNRDYRSDVEGTDIDPEEYRQARLRVEFTLGQPLTTYSDTERALVLDTLRDKLEAKNYTFFEKSQGQVILSKEHSKELEGAVQAAAKATQAQLDLSSTSHRHPIKRGNSNGPMR